MRRRHSSKALPARCTTRKGIHDRPCVGEFFGGGAFEPGESIHRNDLNALTPSIGAGGQPGFEDLLGVAWDHVQEQAGATAVADGRQVQNDGDVPVLMRGVTPYVFIHADDTRAVEPSRIIYQ